MEKRIYNKRIAVGTTNDDPREMILYRNDEKKWNPHFMERLNDYILLFKDLFSDLLNDKLGTEGWGVWFIQFNPKTSSFIVDVYLNDINKFQLVKQLIQDKTPTEIRISDVFFKGNETDFFASLPK